MISRAKIAIISAVLVSVAAVFWVTASRRSEPKVTYSQFLASLQSSQVASVTIMSSSSGAFPAVCRLKDGSTVRTILPAAYGDALRAMQEKLVNVEIRDSSTEPLRLLINTTPFLVLLGFWFFMYRKLRNGPRQGPLIPGP
jgi:ATP-dependent Zn protease